MEPEQDDITGLGNTPEADWPVPPEAPDQPPIDLLKPDSLRHRQVLEYLRQRIKASERAMERFYPRWGVNERKVQAYIDLPDYERMLQEMNDRGAPPKITSVQVPYAFATINTIVTYLLHTFTGRDPMFAVRTNKTETAEAAQYMETALQYNAEHTRMIKKLHQFFHDGETYGLGAMRTRWVDRQRYRTVWTDQPAMGPLGIPTGETERVRARELRTVFQGTEVENIDPYNFLPDPRVPFSEVNRRGEFVFWRNFEGRHSMKQAEADGLIKYLDAVGDVPAAALAKHDSKRSLRSDGIPEPGRGEDAHGLRDYVMLEQGSINIIPRELGLGESDVPETWLFTIANNRQIIQAEPLEADHEMHPVVVSEPYTMGYGLGNAGSADYLGPMQDSISWFINSHIHNVRAALNNMLIVDPSMIEMQDLKNPEPGKLLRLKKAAYGQDVRTAVHQLNVQDITRSHTNDMELFMRIGDSMSAVNDNLRGIQASGGRKTATEVRTSGEAGASRLASHAKLISSQAITDLSEQMCLNMQQNLTEEFAVQVIGRSGVEELVNIVPEMLVGDFYFPVNDGSLPVDKIAMFDIWKEIYLGIAQDQELRQSYDMPGLFNYIAQLGGAKSLDRFQVEMQPNGAAQNAVQSGNGVPMDEVLAGLGGQGMAQNASPYGGAMGG